MKRSNTKSGLLDALKDKRFYNPYNVFHHAPEFYASDDERYKYEIHIVKWNTRSARVIMLYARYDQKKETWIFSKKRGVRRTAHGEKMR